MRIDSMRIDNRRRSRRETTESTAMTSLTTSPDDRDRRAALPTGGSAPALGHLSVRERDGRWDTATASGAAGTRRHRSTGHMAEGAGWFSLLAAAGEWVTWSLSLSAFWLVFTVAGGVLLGVAPASVAAATLVRERTLGRHDRVWRDGARFWVREFPGSQAAVLPLVLVTATLAANYVWFSAQGQGATGARLVTLPALALAATALAWTAPLVAHYTVSPWRVTFLALRLTLARPACGVLLAFVAIAMAYAVLSVPVVAVVAVGAWWTVSTWLCLRFFDDNEERRGDPPSAGPLRTLPTHPLNVS
ncbi:DUF624 domain-containing protein [Streptomyces radicis]|uniref:DUF624 domain-containing protein n=2 Tax=Streptomyces radicis TaxID=1750517 RepID=A0A3A9WH40_9ACTN|nr:DUF624 domain-containing protein [Streptomyces radicis]RKN15854.1 DUF624 domain-containing protein [Streptomyces radicis]